MSDWDIVDHEDLPGGEGTLYLMQHHEGAYAIHVDGRELMSNLLHGSEDALADLACDRLDAVSDARILVGGLGMGFTLAAALRRVGPEGHVCVAELLPAVVRWNQEHQGICTASEHPLDDARVEVFVGDVGEAMGKGFDAILLDVDNGPNALTTPMNGWLYSPEGIARAWNCLSPGGILGIWSSDDSAYLTHALCRAGFKVEFIPHHEDGRDTPEGDETQYVWIATRS